MASKSPEALERKRKRFRDWYNKNRDTQLIIQRARAKADRLTRPLVYWAKELWKLYRITPDKYNELLVRQNYVCAICKESERAVNPITKQPKRLQVDHNHKCCPGRTSCGKCVRGLVCRICNEALVKADSSKNWIENLQTYIGR